MPALLIRFPVSDYSAWKRVFDEQEFARRANGCQGVQIYRNPDHPDETIVLLEWDSLVRARLFAQADEMLESIDWGSQCDRPEIWLLDDIP